MLLRCTLSGCSPEMVCVHRLDSAWVRHLCNYSIYLSYIDWQNNHRPLKMKILQIHFYPWWRCNSHFAGSCHVFACFLDIFFLCVSLIIELSARSLYLLFHCLINLDRWKAFKKTLLLFLKFCCSFKKQSSWLESVLILPLADTAMFYFREAVALLPCIHITVPVLAQHLQYSTSIILKWVIHLHHSHWIQFSKLNYCSPAVCLSLVSISFQSLSRVAFLFIFLPSLSPLHSFSSYFHQAEATSCLLWGLLGHTGGLRLRCAVQDLETAHHDGHKQATESCLLCALLTCTSLYLFSTYWSVIPIRALSCVCVCVRHVKLQIKSLCVCFKQFVIFLLNW